MKTRLSLTLGFLLVLFCLNVAAQTETGKALEVGDPSKYTYEELISKLTQK